MKLTKRLKMRRKWYPRRPWLDIKRIIWRMYTQGFGETKP